MKHGILSFFFSPVSLDDTKELNSPCAATALAGSKLRHAPSTLHFILYLYLFPSRAKETPPQNHYLIPYATKDAASLLHRMLIPSLLSSPPFRLSRYQKKKKYSQNNAPSLHDPSRLSTCWDQTFLFSPANGKLIPIIRLTQEESIQSGIDRSLSGNSAKNHPLERTKKSKAVSFPRSLTHSF